jgi:hypothetical protein
MCVSRDTLVGRNPVPSRRKKIKKEKHPLAWVLGGPAFILGGWGVISTSFPIGVFFIYLGFLLLFLEIFLEPWIVKNVSLFGVCVLMILCLLPVGWFTLAVVSLPGPLEVNSFAMRHHNYQDGTDIAGIAWHKSLTELTVIVSNPIDDRYKEFDLTIHPDKWVYEAAIKDNPAGCILTPLSGEHVIFTTMAVTPPRFVTAARASVGGPLADVHDDAGNVWHPFVSNDGYRLYCDRFPSNSNIQIIFALVSPDDSPPPEAKVTWGKEFVAVADYAAQKCFKTTMLDCLKDRPNPSIVKVDGTYKRGVKKISFSRTVGIGNAD